MGRELAKVTEKGAEPTCLHKINVLHSFCILMVSLRAKAYFLAVAVRLSSPRLDIMDTMVEHAPSLSFAESIQVRRSCSGW